MKKKQKKTMTTEAFDRAFDSGKDVTAALDRAHARRPLLRQRRVNVDFPSWMIDSLDREADRLGVTRQSIIKVWIADRLGGGVVTRPAATPPAVEENSS